MAIKKGDVVRITANKTAKRMGPGDNVPCVYTLIQKGDLTEVHLVMQSPKGWISVKPTRHLDFIKANDYVAIPPHQWKKVRFIGIRRFLQFVWDHI